MRIIKMISFFLTLFLTVCFSAMGQIDNYQKEIIELLNTNGTRIEFEQEYEEVFARLDKNFGNYDIPQKEWQKLRKDKPEQLDEVIRMLSFAYRKHYTQAEINVMKDFFNGEVGQKWVQGEELSVKESKIVDDFFKSEIGRKMESIYPELQKDVDLISRNWRKELFGAKMSTLVKDGYVY